MQMRLEPILIPSALMALALSSQAQTQGSFTAAQATEGQSGVRAELRRMSRIEIWMTVSSLRR